MAFKNIKIFYSKRQDSSRFLNISIYRIYPHFIQFYMWSVIIYLRAEIQPMQRRQPEAPPSQASTVSSVHSSTTCSLSGTCGSLPGRSSTIAQGGSTVSTQITLISANANTAMNSTSKVYNLIVF